MSANSTNFVIEVPQPSKARNRTLWALQILVALVFVAAAAAKLMSVPFAVEEFAQFGLGQWFRYFTAAMELTGAILLVTPRFAAIGGGVLATVMIGAIFADLFVLGDSPIPAGILLVVSSAILWFRRSSHALRPGVR